MNMRQRDLKTLTGIKYMICTRIFFLKTDNRSQLNIFFRVLVVTQNQLLPLGLTGPNFRDTQVWDAWL